MSQVHQNFLEAESIMEIQRIISSLLRTRKEKVILLCDVQRNLADFQKQLSRLYKLSIDSTQEKNEFPKEFTRAALGIKEQIDGVQKEVRRIDGTLRNLINRFQNPTINIGVIGKARQGKSTLLQKISGLSDKIIPSSAGKPCTGAKSRIYHTEGNAHAKVYFFTQEEFLEEIVYPYFDRLKIEKPISLEDFKEVAPQISLDPDRANVLDKEIYNYLLFIHRNFAEVSEFLSSEPKEISLEDIPEYVTQSAESAKYLAVKHADIFTSFPNHNVTGLCFVDLPGLEAVKLHEKKLIASLQSEVDAVILIKCPSAVGAHFDTDELRAIDLIDEAVQELNLNNWSFLVLNALRDGSNKEQVEILKNEPLSALNLDQIITANCASQTDVQQEVFSVVLKYVEQNLLKLDRQRVDSHTSYIRDISEKLNRLVMPLEQALLTASDTNDADIIQEAVSLSSDFYNELARSLEILVGRLQPSEEEATRNKDKFRQAVETLCDNLESNPHVTDSEQLQREYYDKGGWPAVVQKSLHVMRSRLTSDLSKLDESLQEMVAELYERLLSQLLPEDIMVRLLPDSEEFETKTPSEKMSAVRDLFDDEAQPILYKAFTYAVTFNFSYHSHFHYRVRQEMVALDPMQNRDAVAQLVREGAGNHLTTQEFATEIHNGLRAYYLRAVSEIRNKLLEELQADPSKALFALAEELKDRFVRSEGVEKEWRTFLVRRKGQIWPNKFGSSEVLKELSGEWRLVIREAIKQVEAVHDGLRRI